MSNHLPHLALTSLLTGGALLCLASCAKTDQAVHFVEPIVGDEGVALPVPAVDPRPADPPFPEADLPGDRPLGAAHFLPADCSAFTAVHDLDGLAKDFWNSRAMQIIRATPGAIMGIAQAQQEEPIKQARGFLTTEFGLQVGDALQQIVDDEIFLALDAATPRRLAALQSVSNRITWQDTLGKLEEGRSPAGGAGEPSPRLIVDAVLAHKDELAMPAGMIGFRLREPDRVSALLDMLLTEIIAQLPPGLHDGPPAEGPWSHRIALQAGMFLAPQRDRLHTELLGAGVAEAQATEFLDFLAGVTLHVELTLRDDYLLLAIGPDATFLGGWGAAEPLASGTALLPIRSLHRPGLFSVSYQNSALSGLMHWSPEQVRQAMHELGAVLQNAPLDPAMVARLQKDLPAYGERIATLMPEPGPTLACSFRERGLRSFLIQRSADDHLPANSRLAIRRLAGAEPLLASASQNLARRNSLALLADLYATTTGYLSDFLLPSLSADERDEVEPVLTAATAYGQTLLTVVQSDMATALGETYQSLLTVEAGGRLTGLPPAARLRDGLAMPMTGLAIEIAEADALRQGATRLFKATETFVGAVLAAQEGVEAKGFRLPAPVRAERDGVSWWHYATPFGEDLRPCAALTDDLLLLGTSPRQVAAMLERRDDQLPDAGPSRTAYAQIDVAAWTSLIMDIARTVYEAQAEGRLDQADQIQQQALIIMHAQSLVQAMQSIDGLYFSVEKRDGWAVTETWWRTVASE